MISLSFFDFQPLFPLRCRAASSLLSNCGPSIHLSICPSFGVPPLGMSITQLWAHSPPKLPALLDPRTRLLICSTKSFCSPLPLHLLPPLQHPHSHSWSKGQVQRTPPPGCLPINSISHPLESVPMSFPSSVSPPGCHMRP